ncbi:acetate--CoA ligase family protein [Alkalihalobacillus sp. BA299]|uniref:acetate--CoA ligase family protein n=1 Tax=Alkalihalobacillus sp. BA299 TaxID=2815938 RepID=UPI001AD98155|nr:acetate--CoA ligase family protein [Alkalihalobacillus sp. BA299]
MTYSLKSIFNPASVAIIGASPNIKKVGGRALKFLLASDYKGKVYPINPNYQDIQGLKAFPSITELPEAPEQIILCVPSEKVYGVIEEAVRIGVKGAIIFSGGFAEADDKGIEMQNKMTKIAKDGGLTILGPNCMGVINQNEFIGTYTTILEENELNNSPIAFVGQSGAIGAYSFILGVQSQMDLGVLVSTGNEVMVDVADCISYFAVDPKIKVIMTYLEGCRDGKKLEEGLKKAALNGKVILACKVGRTQEGERAASSHTANMVGNDEIYDTLFEKYNVIRCDDIESMVDIANLYSKNINIKGNNVGIMSLSGGIGVMATDKCIEQNLNVPVFHKETSSKIKSLVSFAGADNPLDPTAQGLDDPKLLEQLLEGMVNDPNIDVALFCFGYFLLSEGRGPIYADVICNVAKKSKIPVVVAGLANQEVINILQEQSIPIFGDLNRAVGAVSSVYHMNTTEPQVVDRLETSKIPLTENTSRILNKLKSQATLNEVDAKAILNEFHLPVPQSNAANSEQESIAIANSIGYPVVLKVVGKNILHKSDLGGVCLNLVNEEEVAVGYQSIMNNVSAKINRLEIEGIMVEKMNTAKPVCEMLISVSVDQNFGSNIVVGLGGIFTELLNDYVILQPPFDTNYINKSLKKLKGYKLLEGYRSQEKADLEALINFITNLGDLAYTLEDKISELEMNPVAVYQEGMGIQILDAVIKGKEEKKIGAAVNGRGE